VTAPALRASEADPRLAALIEQARELFAQRYDGLFVFDAALTVREWNPRIEELSGRPRNRVIGRPLPELFARLRDEPRTQPLRDALQGRTLQLRGDCCVLADPELAAGYDTHFLPLLRDGAESVRSQLL